MAATAHLIFGGDEYLVSAKARELVNDALPPDEQTFGLEVVDGAVDTVDEAVVAVRKCRESLLTVSFFSTRRVVWFKNVACLSADTKAWRSDAVKAAVNELAAIVKQGLPEGVVLFVSASAVDKRYAFYKAFEAAGCITEFAVDKRPHVMEREARQRATELATKLGLKLDTEALNAFLERVGTDTRMLAGELQKLAAYVGGRTNVNEADVLAICSPTREAVSWDLADAVGNRDLQAAISVLRQLLFQKQSHVGLIIGLESRFRDLLLFRQGLDRKWLVPTGSTRGGMNYAWRNVPQDVDNVFANELGRDPRKQAPFRIAVLARQAANFSPAELRRGLRAVTQAHEKLVSTSTPPGLVLELLLMTLLATRRTRATTTERQVRA